MLAELQSLNLVYLVLDTNVNRAGLDLVYLGLDTNVNRAGLDLVYLGLDTNVSRAAEFEPSISSPRYQC